MDKKRESGEKERRKHKNDLGFVLVTYFKIKKNCILLFGKHNDMNTNDKECFYVICKCRPLKSPKP